ncbi:GMC family oxidoreductase [Streptomyces sp. NPDC020965]|uniref:GMC family oxidoreductase n=1 Tax=Streptomyces sp. NPDC020965 TaxID=3365105 RepID=UPI0037989FB0
MFEVASSTSHDPREIARQVRAGTLSRRSLLQLFGVSAASAGLVAAGEKPGSARSHRYDYVIVGAGSAGCTLAARLLADSHARVLLIEAGGTNDLPEVRDFTKAASLSAPGSPLNWPLRSEPQSALMNRPQSFVCGKLAGGSSSINGMVWVRGNPGDYDHWAAQGAAGWDYTSVRPSLDALTGPIHPSDELTRRNALSTAFVDAAVELGYPYNADYNGVSQFGAAYTQLNVVNGIRQDAFTTFLAPYLTDPRLTVVTDAHATRLTFDRRKAIDRVVVESGGREYTVTAEREVIVSTGTVNTAHLMQLSGIGAAKHLSPHGINVVIDLPGVGANLHDHLISVVSRALRTPEPQSHTTSMDVNVFTGRGQVPGTPRFEFQTYYSRVGYPPAPDESTSIGVMNLHPTSRGYVKLRSADPHTPPMIQPNFLHTRKDLEYSLEGFELSLELMNARPLRTWVKSENVVPDTPVRTRRERIAALRAFAQSDFHPVGTCRMGTDALAVVDPQLRVRGVSGLRLASAAIMPSITSGNTNAPSMMIGDRCGRLILGLA